VSADRCELPPVDIEGSASYPLGNKITNVNEYDRGGKPATDARTRVVGGLQAEQDFEKHLVNVASTGKHHTE
jgi:hypothetical protein